MGLSRRDGGRMFGPYYRIQHSAEGLIKYFGKWCLLLKPMDAVTVK